MINSYRHARLGGDGVERMEGRFRHGRKIPLGTAGRRQTNPLYLAKRIQPAPVWSQVSARFSPPRADPACNTALCRDIASSVRRGAAGPPSLPHFCKRDPELSPCTGIVFGEIDRWISMNDKPAPRLLWCRQASRLSKPTDEMKFQYAKIATDAPATSGQAREAALGGTPGSRRQTCAKNLSSRSVRLLRTALPRYHRDKCVISDVR
jgi:hypothetical protein